MLKLWGGRHAGDRRVLVLGLSDGNIGRLRKDQPIHIFGAELGLQHDIVICWGETEGVIAEKLGLAITDAPARAPRN